MNDNDGDGDGASADDDVGYCRPPKSGQFKKGHSGNLRGRPRKPTIISAAAFADSTFDRSLIEEMERPVVIRDGDKSEKATLVRAGIRSLSVKAAKGDVPSFKEIMKERHRIEIRRQTEWEVNVRFTLEYKQDMNERMRLEKKRGEVGPEIVPHPDDIEINFEKREIEFNGPITREQKLAQDFLIANGGLLFDAHENASGMSSVDPRTFRLGRRQRRRYETITLLVRKRASRVNSWELATIEERTDFLRRVVWPDFSAHMPFSLAQSEVCFKSAMRRYLNIELTKGEQLQLRRDIRREFPDVFTSKARDRSRFERIS